MCDTIPVAPKDIFVLALRTIQQQQKCYIAETWHFLKLIKGKLEQ